MASEIIEELAAKRSLLSCNILSPIDTAIAEKSFALPVRETQTSAIECWRGSQICNCNPE